jgi:hypothetical protein
VEAPEGMEAIPMAPDSRKTRVLKVGFPLESRISMASIFEITFFSMIHSFPGFSTVLALVIRLGFF